jgi:hypothetical protein
VNMQLACGCVNIYYQNKLADVKLCKDHEVILSWIMSGKAEDDAPPTLGVSVSEQIKAKEKVE